jgi:molybdopterin biosynthesis enzyme MoaB
MIRAGIITVSDRSAQHLREDASGPVIAAILANVPLEIAQTIIVHDELDRIKKAIKQFADIDNNNYRSKPA